MFGELGEKIAYFALKLIILAALMGLAFIYIPRDSISGMAQTAVNWKNSVQTAVQEQYPIAVSRVAAEAGELRAEASKAVQNIKEQAKEASSAKIKAELNNWVDNLFKSK